MVYDINNIQSVIIRLDSLKKNYPVDQHSIIDKELRVYQDLRDNLQKLNHLHFKLKNMVDELEQLISQYEE